jgi:transposase-like protein
MSPMPRVARAPHSSKVPEACPHCGSHVLTRRGTRRKKLEIVQLWRCASCKRTFTPSPPALRNKTYPLRVILEALIIYSLGYSADETIARLKPKTGRSIARSTLELWLKEHHDVLSYRRLRANGRHRYPPAQTIRSIKLYHRQVYGFAAHRPKLELVRDGLIDEKRAGDVRLAPVANFLEAVPAICPHDLFRSENSRGRASQAQPPFADVSRIQVVRKENAATRAAALVIPAVGDNKQRHESLQRFMLATDSVTVAIEVPIWLREADISAIEAQHGIELVPRVGAAERTITGHIDFLQVRNGCLHILDYKPDARTNKPIAQLAIYALALTRLVPGLKLFDIKCAWFNEEEYCEFFPRLLFSRPKNS